MACGIHYQYHHEGDHQIFSVVRFKRESSFKIGKSHSCPECKITYNTLTELSSHLLQSKHFPQSSSAYEINLLECTIDCCQFKTVNFHALKQHVTSNHFSKNDFCLKPSKYEKKQVNVKVRTYAIPTSYLHLPRIDCNNMVDNKNELEAIEDLLELYKGHAHEDDYRSMIQVLNVRKDTLKKKE